MPVTQFYLQSKRMPFVRLLLPLMAGILLQWYFHFSLFFSIIGFGVVLCLYLSYFFLSSYQKFQLQWLRGVLCLLMLIFCGAALTLFKNPLHQTGNFTNAYKPGEAVVAVVNEALVPKAKTYKAVAKVIAVYHDNKAIATTGNIILYLDKKTIDSNVQYGSQILFKKPLQSIGNFDTINRFDYRRYLLFQGITAQVYLKGNEYNVVQQQQGFSFDACLIDMQQYIIRTIQTYIPDKKESGVAEALLIGYRNDLDKQLVQSYSNTGVVHIIAISGLHLGMIYGFILFLFSRYKNRNWYRFVVPFVALFVLWLFTLLAGAVPSILRSAITFSFLAFGMFINRKGSVYNTLAASAFCLLVFNPFLLWDVGFQLSYAAVISITVFTKPLYHTLYFQNPLLNKIWLATVVTLAAQILTLPIILYNFHQFPVLFIITNLLVVFLSEIILFAILLLLIIGEWIPLATLVGKGVQAMLWLMNTIIERTERIPFSLLQNINLDELQVWLLYGMIVLLAIWLLYKMPRFLLYGMMLCCLLLLDGLVSSIYTNQQKKGVASSILK